MTDHDRSPDDDATITYTVRELLKDIKKDQVEGFARVEKGLETKADQAHVQTLTKRVDRHDETIGELQEFKAAVELTAEVKGEHARRQWTLGAKLLTIAGTILTLAVMLAAAYISHYGL